jgi:predicted O-methyltransferase YrrM
MTIHASADRVAPVFHEDWYSAPQLRLLAESCSLVRRLPGAVLEIGSWEGKSTAVLANACYPETLVAVDTWQGNLDEAADHPSVLIARQRDVLGVFLRNMAALTRGNVLALRMDCHEFLTRCVGPVKFCHIDASHDYRSVRRTIEALLPMIVAGAVLCGDDIQTAHAGRTDLQGGVERAVRECLPGFQEVGNFWRWMQGDRPALHSHVPCRG